MEIGQWLRGLGLQSYEQAFRDNGIECVSRSNADNAFSVLATITSGFSATISAA